jgi:hypothetical protein
MCICTMPPAPRVPIAAQVDVSVASDEGNLEGTHGVDVIVQGRIDVPCSKKAISV